MSSDISLLDFDICEVFKGLGDELRSTFPSKDDSFLVIDPFYARGEALTWARAQFENDNREIDVVAYDPVSTIDIGIPTEWRNALESPRPPYGGAVVISVPPFWSELKPETNEMNSLFRSFLLSLCGMPPLTEDFDDVVDYIKSARESVGETEEMPIGVELETVEGKDKLPRSGILLLPSAFFASKNPLDTRCRLAFFSLFRVKCANVYKCRIFEEWIVSRAVAIVFEIMDPLRHSSSVDEVRFFEYDEVSFGREYFKIPFSEEPRSLFEFPACLGLDENIEPSPSYIREEPPSPIVAEPVSCWNLEAFSLKRPSKGLALTRSGSILLRFDESWNACGAIESRLCKYTPSPILEKFNSVGEELGKRFPSVRRKIRGKALKPWERLTNIVFHTYDDPRRGVRIGMEYNPENANLFESNLGRIQSARLVTMGFEMEQNIQKIVCERFNEFFECWRSETFDLGMAFYRECGACHLPLEIVFSLAMSEIDEVTGVFR